MVKVLNEPSLGRPVDEMWAYLAVDENGEGVIGMSTQLGWMPLVGADGERMRSYRTIVERLAKETKREIRLVRFTQREEIETIKP